MSRSDLRLQRAAPAAAALAAYSTCLLARGWPRDDRWLILEHPLIRAGWPALKPLLLSGYVSPVLGAETPIHEWRPLLSLSFLLQRATTGFASLPLHAVNWLLHAAVAVLVFEVLRRRMPARAAAAGAAVFAVLPIHAEVVAYLTSRSEELAALSALGAWLLLGLPERPGPKRIAAGTLVYAAGALSKENALMFPLFLALADWTFARRLPWDRERRRVYLGLGLAAAAVLAGRSAILPSIAASGVSYFAGAAPLVRLLTLAKFWVWSYARPAALGVGLCSDFSRPLVPDAGLDDLAAWACLLGLAAAFAAAARALRRRESWGFWLLAPCAFLLPTSQLLMNLDVIGAQRFLYLPSLGLAAAAAALFARAETRAPLAARAGLAAILLALGARSAARALDWRDEEAFDRSLIACNPASAKARAALGVDSLRAGRAADGEQSLLAALRLNPELYEPGYNLAVLEFGHAAFGAARARLETARRSRPDEPDGLVLSALLDERDRRYDDAAAKLQRAVAVNPYDAKARFDLARSLARLGRTAAAAAEVRAYLRLAPDDPEAGLASRWLETLESAQAPR